MKLKTIFTLIFGGLAYRQFNLTLDRAAIMISPSKVNPSPTILDRLLGAVEFNPEDNNMLWLLVDMSLMVPFAIAAACMVYWEELINTVKIEIPDLVNRCEYLQLDGELKNFDKLLFELFKKIEEKNPVTLGNINVTHPKLIKFLSSQEVENLAKISKTDYDKYIEACIQYKEIINSACPITLISPKENHINKGEQLFIVICVTNPNGKTHTSVYDYHALEKYILSKEISRLPATTVEITKHNCHMSFLFFESDYTNYEPFVKVIKQSKDKLQSEERLQSKLEDPTSSYPQSFGFFPPKPEEDNDVINYSGIVKRF